MRYFKVPVRMDGKRVFRQLADGSLERTFTPVREIEMSRKKVYWCFGARFAV